MNKNAKWDETIKTLHMHGIMPYRTLLSGKPGTGKSTLPKALYGEVERLTVTVDSAPEDLLGSWVMKNGNMTFQDGPVVRAFRQGIPLVIDEIDAAGPSVETLLHQVLDDPKVAVLTLPTGERIIPKGGFRVFATTNANPHALTEALLDRFDLVLLCNTPAPGILENLEKDEAILLTNHYANMKFDAWRPSISSRRMQAFSKFRKTLGSEVAAYLVFGESAKEVLANLQATTVG